MAKPAHLQDGILPSQDIEALIAASAIRLSRPAVPGQVQPASLDLRLGARVWRVRASFLPGRGVSIADKLRDYALHEIDVTQGAVLETGCVYVAELAESLALPEDLSAAANPKSSTGRLDVFTRVIADGGREFDTIETGYAGPLYAEISPRTFPVLVREGSRLSQVRFRRGNRRTSDADLRALHAIQPIVSTIQANIQGGLVLSVDLAAKPDGGPIGYRAKRHTGLIDVDKVAGYQMADFWEPIHAGDNASLILDPAQFYILASKEAVAIPPGFAAEMEPFNPLVGEFRVHYAGFFDPGFGYSGSGGAGSRAVLEVRSHEVPFILEDGQTIGKLVYEPMAAVPATVYGSGIGSNYQKQGLKLSKHFK